MKLYLDHAIFLQKYSACMIKIHAQNSPEYFYCRLQAPDKNVYESRNEKRQQKNGLLVIIILPMECAQAAFEKYAIKQSIYRWM